MPARRALVALLFWSIALPALAQDRPFLFSVSTARDPEAPALRVTYDLGVGEHEFQGGSANQPEQRIGLHAAWRRLTMIGRVGLVSAGSSYQSSQSGEVLISLVAPAPTGLSLAAGGGILHEAGGADVLLARLVGGHEATAWRLHGNLVLQKPLATGRDAVDLIMTAGWARRVTAAVAIGVEGLGEDLEGFWDPVPRRKAARAFSWGPPCTSRRRVVAGSSRPRAGRSSIPSAPTSPAARFATCLRPPAALVTPSARELRFDPSERGARFARGGRLAFARRRGAQYGNEPHEAASSTPAGGSAATAGRRRR